jgi:hypothetical protein
MMDTPLVHYMEGFQNLSNNSFTVPLCQLSVSQHIGLKVAFGEVFHGDREGYSGLALVPAIELNKMLSILP